MKLRKAQEKQKRREQYMAQQAAKEATQLTRRPQKEGTNKQVKEVEEKPDVKQRTGESNSFNVCKAFIPPPLYSQFLVCFLPTHSPPSWQARVCVAASDDSSVCVCVCVCLSVCLSVRIRLNFKPLRWIRFTLIDRLNPIIRIVGITFTCAMSVVGSSNPPRSSLFFLNLNCLTSLRPRFLQAKKPCIHIGHPITYQSRDTEGQRYRFQSVV